VLGEYTAIKAGDTVKRTTTLVVPVGEALIGA